MRSNGDGLAVPPYLLDHGVFVAPFGLVALSYPQ